MKTFFTPGPTHLFPKVDTFIQEALAQQVPSISHRSKAYQAIHAEAVEGLRAVFGLPDHFYVFFHASATEIWERLLQNLVDQHSFHFVNGSFSDRFYKAALSLQLSPTLEKAEWGEGFAFDQVQIPAEIEMINFTHNETSTGVMIPEHYVHQFSDGNPQALVTVDTVSSAPYARWDWSKVDAMYFSVQKCFGLPAGLGVLVLNEACMERARQREKDGQSLGTYHSFIKQYDKHLKNQTVETPNMLGIFLLGKVCQEMLKRGIDQMRSETDQRAEMLYQYFEQHPSWYPFVKDPAFRSQTVVVVDIPEGSQTLIDYLGEKGMIVGNGYGKMKGKQIRIANFPSLSMEDMERLLTAIRDFS